VLIYYSEVRFSRFFFDFSRSSYFDTIYSINHPKLADFYNLTGYPDHNSPEIVSPKLDSMFRNGHGNHEIEKS